jgi:hypothetical protein
VDAVDQELRGAEIRIRARDLWQRQLRDLRRRGSDAHENQRDADRDRLGERRRFHAFLLCSAAIQRGRHVGRHRQPACQTWRRAKGSEMLREAGT